MPPKKRKLKIVQSIEPEISATEVIGNTIQGNVNKESSNSDELSPLVFSTDSTESNNKSLSPLEIKISQKELDNEDEETPSPVVDDEDLVTQIAIEQPNKETDKQGNQEIPSSIVDNKFSNSKTIIKKKTKKKVELKESFEWSGKRCPKGTRRNKKTGKCVPMKRKLKIIQSIEPEIPSPIVDDEDLVTQIDIEQPNKETDKQGNQELPSLKIGRESCRERV